MYGVGQIAGPPLAAWLVARSGNAGRGFALSLWIASGILAGGALLYLLLARAYPVQALSAAPPVAPAGRGSRPDTG
jgi:hypothetical protein